MYGTIGHYRIKPGMREAALKTLHEQESVLVPGIVAVHVYQLDRNPDEVMLVVMFESRGKPILPMPTIPSNMNAIFKCGSS